MEKLYCICVDDQPEVLQSVARDLKGFSDWVVIEECESATEAGSLLEELDTEGKAVALIICDHIMPGTRGVDFLTRVASSSFYAGIKKILLTGQATHSDTIEAINRAHVDAYVEKPWNAESLQATVRRLLTEYVFDRGFDSCRYGDRLDQQVVLQRLRGRE